MSQHTPSVFDYAIVGQGIAGTLMAYFLKKAGKNVLIMDNGHKGSSSVVAAGIVNPVTGKSFVTSWRIHDFIPKALEIYDELAEYLGIPTYTKANLIRALENVEDENNWLARTTDPIAARFMLSSADMSEFEGKINSAMGYGELTGTFYVHLKNILIHCKKKWLDEGTYFEQMFEHNLLQLEGQRYVYNNFQFEGIIFCEGYQALNNPFFTNIGLAPSKGEVLIVRIPEASFTKMFKDKIFIVRQYDDVYWVGSGYAWNAPDDSPTEKNYITLSNELTRILKIPFEILGHQAAIRPTMHSRRPVFLIHPSMKETYLFNGLGTKGASIGPFAAQQFTNYLLNRNIQDMSLI